MKNKSKDKRLPSLSEIVNGAPKTPYSTKSLDEYSTQLSKMNLLELQTHAVSLGIRPSGDRQLLEKTLTNMFKNSGRELKNLAIVQEPKVSKVKTLLDLINSKK